MITVDVKSKNVIIEIENIAKLTNKAIRRAFYNIGKDLVKTASNNILKRGRRGRAYKVGGRRHVASVEGESWSNLTGKARRSLNFRISGSDNMRFGATAPYAKFLEDGTKKMGERPALRISIEQNNRNMENRFRQAIREELC